jgi:hypothetical protein
MVKRNTAHSQQRLATPQDIRPALHEVNVVSLDPGFVGRVVECVAGAATTVLCRAAGFDVLKRDIVKCLAR